MKIFFNISILAVLLISCGKNNEFDNNFASVNVINAAPGVPASQLFVDTAQKTATALTFRTATGYNSVSPGTRNVEIRNNLRLTQILANNSFSFENGKGYTYFLYDTLTSPSATVRLLRLEDNLSLPAANTVKVRFAHLAINAPAVDITFVRVPNNDSVTISNRSYIGASPVLPMISQTEAFSAIPIGNYNLRVKLAGTQTVVTTFAAALTAPSSIVTFYAAGTAQGQALSINAFRNY